MLSGAAEARRRSVDRAVARCGRTHLPTSGRSSAFHPQEDSAISPQTGHNREIPDVKLTAIDSNALPWEERFNEKMGRSLYSKNLIVDPDTGMEVRLVRYPAGSINPLHTHPCAHGMYVLEGTLVYPRWSIRTGAFRLVPRRNADGARRRCGAGCDGPVYH